MPVRTDPAADSQEAAAFEVVSIRAAQAVKGYTDTKNRLTGQPRNRIYALKLTPGHRLKLCQAVAA
jgi:hypothetical protein